MQYLIMQLIGFPANETFREKKRTFYFGSSRSRFYFGTSFE